MIVGSGSRAPATAYARRRGWARFAERYGWRAYALPVLSAVTLWVLVHGTPGGAATPSAHSAGPPAHSVRAPAHSAHRDAAALARHSGKMQHPSYLPAATPQPVVVRHEVESATCSDNRYAQLVLVSISQQHAWMCDGHRQVYSTPVTTGATFDNRQTPLGSWRVQDKQRDRYLVGPGYRDYVKYWVPFNGDFGLHDASWQTMPFGSQGYRTQGSHGCVHLPTPAMAWVYSWAKVGRTVVTVES